MNLTSQISRAGAQKTEQQGHILIVGNPNVGKSALFNRLTGQYVTVSNYPGTTVEVTRGHCPSIGKHLDVIDTPGMYSLLPITAEEKVAADMLFTSPIHAVVHVIDAKNISRMLGLTLQLIEAGFPVILVLNMIDEARRIGLNIDIDLLRHRLGIPIIATVSTSGEGIPELIEVLRHPPSLTTPVSIDYGPVLNPAIELLGTILPPSHSNISLRGRATLLLQRDESEGQRLRQNAGEKTELEVTQLIADTRKKLAHAPHYFITLATRAKATALLEEIVAAPVNRRGGWQHRLNELCINPWTGFPILAAVLYFALFKFVGSFGAGTLVDWIETYVFEKGLNPFLIKFFETIIPWPVVRDLFTGDYGIFTLGLRYAVAIIFPIVGLFFFVFAILEDSGYLPRLALLVDRMMKWIGLSGRAIIPLSLGFGCDTMATVVTRTLETRRERLICTLLLALAIPCSAQLGVILGLLALHPFALPVWIVAVGGVSLVVGLLASRFVPGTPPLFYMELPPLRMPQIGNVATKTGARMIWYFKEIFPMFLIASALIWVGKITGLFGLIIRGMLPAMHALGLPDQSAVAFLFGFFRRDYGAAGLYDLQKAGIMTGNQLTVAAIVLTLFLPCIAQFLVMQKEQGTRMTLIISGAVLTIAFVIGWGVNGVLTLLGVHL